MNESDTTTVGVGEMTISIARSDGADDAFVVFIDTTFEPDGSDGGPGLRVMINDDDAYIGVPYGEEGQNDDE